jgi:hypothetical protein
LLCDSTIFFGDIAYYGLVHIEIFGRMGNNTEKRNTKASKTNKQNKPNKPKQPKNQQPTKQNQIKSNKTKQTHSNTIEQ